MSLDAALASRFERSFGLWRDLVETIGYLPLRQRLGSLPSNTIGEQIWCVVGARESYARAIAARGWLGFACSLTDPGNEAHVAAALLRSEDVVRKALEAAPAPGDVQARYMLDLLEHEAAHQGQIIRYLYGLELPIPPSWQSRYALD